MFWFLNSRISLWTSSWYVYTHTHIYVYFNHVFGIAILPTTLGKEKQEISWLTSQLDRLFPRSAVFIFYFLCFISFSFLFSETAIFKSQQRTNVNWKEKHPHMKGPKCFPTNKYHIKKILYFQNKGSQFFKGSFDWCQKVI